MRKILSAITIVSCFLFACNNSGSSSDESTGITSDSSFGTTTPIVSDPVTQAPSFDSNATLTAPVPATVAQQQPAVTTAAGMNPAHGEPGHRCEIAVGAPLNSPATAPAAQAPGSAVTTPSMTPALTTPSSTAPPLTATPAPTAAPTTTAPGMNPPHGQPGHDCAIAVGAPLKKK